LGPPFNPDSKIQSNPLPVIQREERPRIMLREVANITVLSVEGGGVGAHLVTRNTIVFLNSFSIVCPHRPVEKIDTY
jgi:hypothetical protein